MGSDRWARLLSALVAVIALAVGLVGCGGGGSDHNNSSSHTSITGVVVDRQTNDPVVGATVNVSGHTAKTSASGSFQLSVAPGPLTMTVTATGFQTGNFSAVADEGLTTNVGVLSLVNSDTNPPSPPV
jgi:hypothetical protein